MNKMYKVIATASILTMAAMPVAANAQSIPTATPAHYGQISIGNILSQLKVISGTMGQITDFTNDKTGKFITVTGRGVTPSDQSKIVLSITKDTKIIDSKGKRVALQTIMDEKKAVKAFYSPKITKSIPARGTASTLIVQDQSFTGIDGKVTEVKENGIVVTGKDIYNSNEDTMVLHFANNAVIIDQNGKAIKATDIKVGMSVKAFYGPAVTMSIPAQSTTNYVVVNTEVEESVQEEVAGTNGIITNVEDSRITLIGSAMEQGGASYVMLSVDEKTQIVDEEGKTLTKDALKADVRVDAYYGPVMALSFPGQTHAEKIVVKAEETNKIEGTIAATDDAAKDQVYVNVGSDKSRQNDVILNISEDTKVISMVGGETELKAGMKVVAYHSSIMTRSLPGITNAEIVIITQDDSMAAPNQ